jgi:hypothetical protein
MGLSDSSIVLGPWRGNPLVFACGMRSPVRVFPHAHIAHRGRRAEECPVGDGAKGQHEAGELDRR